MSLQSCLPHISLRVHPDLLLERRFPEVGMNVNICESGVDFQGRGTDEKGSQGHVPASYVLFLSDLARARVDGEVRGRISLRLSRM